MPGFFQLKTYFNYWLDAVDEHSLHSPFLFDLYTKVINIEEEGIPAIEKLRTSLLKTDREISVVDLGAGSKHTSNKKRLISEIAENSLSDVRFSLLYLRLIKHIDAKNIIELGTSFGINTLYLAQKKNTRVFTFEGSESIAEVAQDTFEFASAKNVELVRGNIDSTLYSSLSRMPKADFLFMDANHRYAPTIKYFDELLPKIHHQSILVLDDIHSSHEMEKAWKEIKNHDLVYTSIDLYRCGILFFDPSLNKQHVVLQFKILK
ncbi:MAG TPA: class I SAM-dependent methyltransferase [Cyclobacteriaceae bacterium]|nr:class I SAM-dependent methyltransferase [Cyclobacteriaceae bacterium]